MSCARTRNSQQSPKTELLRFDFNNNEKSKKKLRALYEGDNDHFTRKRDRRYSSNVNAVYLFLILAISASIFICNLMSDISTARLFQIQNRLGESYATFALAVVPIAIVNIFSLILFLEEEPEPTGRTTSPFRMFRLLSFLFLGVFERRIETMCRKMDCRCLKKKNTILSENLSSSLVHENQQTAILTLIQSFLHDLPQMILQSYVCIRAIQNSKTEEEMQCSELCKSQMKSILFSMLSFVTALMNYHRSRRPSMRIETGKYRNCFLLYFYQWIWLTGTTGSRIFIFSMAMANVDSALTYFAFISFHWLVYTIYFKNKNEGKPVAIEICSIEVPTEIQILMENSRDWSLGIAHTFCFLDNSVSIWKDRIEVKTFHSFIVFEDMVFLISWYVKSPFAHWFSTSLWIYYMPLSCYYIPFFTGIAAMVLYFQKLKQLTIMRKENSAKERA